MAQLVDLVQRLAELDEETLQQQLGIQAQSIGEDLIRNASIETIDVDTRAVVSRGLESNKALEFGQRLFKHLNAEAYDLLCSSDPFGDGGKTMQQIESAYKDSSMKAAGVLAPILVANL
jgi:hypothetical protein